MPPVHRSAQYLLGQDVLTTNLDASTGTITAQLGDVDVDQATSLQALVIQQPGFASRPALAISGQRAAQAWGFRGGSQNVILGMSDSRTAAMYGALDHGETSVYASEGQARVLLKNDGSISLYTTVDNTANGAALAFTMSPTEGVILMTPWGGFSITSDGLKFYTQDGSAFGGSFELTKAGVVTMLGPTFKAAMGQVLLGVGATAATPALSSPIPVIGGSASGTAVPSLSVFVG